MIRVFLLCSFVCSTVNVTTYNSAGKVTLQVPVQSASYQRSVNVAENGPIDMRGSFMNKENTTKTLKCQVQISGVGPWMAILPGFWPKCHIVVDDVLIQVKDLIGSKVDETFYLNAVFDFDLPLRPFEYTRFAVASGAGMQHEAIVIRRLDTNTVIESESTFEYSKGCLPGYGDFGKGFCEAPPTPIPEKPTPIPEKPTTIPEKPTTIPEKPTTIPEKPTQIPEKTRPPVTTQTMCESSGRNSDSDGTTISTSLPESGKTHKFGKTTIIAIVVSVLTVVVIVIIVIIVSAFLIHKTDDDNEMTSQGKKEKSSFFTNISLSFSAFFHCERKNKESH
ncbi:hypothetical protein TRFO_28423 [Tritrichomonas foetus]|uniref:Uncharacterized protein n=1 Tax=Tritrichomonas foetus TaxID=1144522 RepID=A0A1J4K2W1_9EUKA|nr:hypothetical protein TRFO_28423 [Tritrichomonas foetus]|eukprot:OHT04070.1 hypothetical protein TRFO_28423 [Tritrichomonas foetus]